MDIPEGRKSRFVGKSGQQPGSHSKQRNGITPIKRPNTIPKHLLENELLGRMIKELLPATYQFEIHKTIHQVTENQVQTLGLQMPEGLLQFALTISDLIKQFCPSCRDVIILGDVTYGACCVDDFTAKALGCQMLVHYGHSCLIPVDQTSIKTLYVFVEIGIDRAHLRDTIVKNFPECLRKSDSLLEGFPAAPESRLHRKEETPNSSIQHIHIEHEEESCGSSHCKKQEITLALVGTVQFVSAVQALKHDLEELSITTIDTTPDHVDHLPIQFSNLSAQCRFNAVVPQIKPLSPGEILGCTAPKLSPDVDAIVYIGDGRFHLESIMIANPKIPAFRYDPYSKKLTYEAYDHFQMRQVRNNAIQQASVSLSSMSSLDEQGADGDQDSSTNSKRKKIQSCDKSWAVVLGTLGRQGSLSVLKSITEGFRIKSTKTAIIPILISELSFEKLAKFQDHINVFVQTSCPRLSIDWGEGFVRTSTSSTTAANNTMGEVTDEGEVAVEIPMLNPYEAKVALGQAPGFQISLNPVPSSSPNSHPPDHKGLLETYPMDFYADDSLGDWTPRFGKGRPRRHHESQKSMTART